MTPPYLKLDHPDWAMRAALAIARDLCERHGIQDEMLRLDTDMRHDLLLAHAHRIRSEWQDQSKRLAAGLQRMGVATIEDAADQMTAMREQARVAAAFSRSVYDQRPNCWTVAMVEACGPGIYHPPRVRG